jgi:ParB family chromosome partitioning protein
MLADIRKYGPMSSSAAFWRLDRMSAGVREAAELASVGAGMPLSAWLTRLINDTAVAEGVSTRDTSTVIEFARKSFDSTVVVPTGESPAPGPGAPASATMLPVAAIAPANLGTRQGETVPESLLADIAKQGVRQALRVRRAAGANDRFELICGHRRWRAAQRGGLAQVPALLCNDDDGQAILASLAENLSGGDLSVIEEAQAYFRLLTQYAVEISAITQASGRERQSIVRRLRLLGLPVRLRQLIAAGSISPEHADLLLDATNPEGLADAILAERLSVETARQRLGRAKEPGA